MAKVNENPWYRYIPLQDESISKLDRNLYLVYIVFAYAIPVTYIISIVTVFIVRTDKVHATYKKSLLLYLSIFALIGAYALGLRFGDNAQSVPQKELTKKEIVSQAIVSNDIAQLQDKIQGIDLNEKLEGGLSYLHVAVMSHRTQMLQALLEAGAQPDIIDDNSLTPLYLAASYGEIEMVDILLKYGADINFKGHNDITVLHAAAYSGELEVFKLLLNRGADLAAKTTNGLSALDMAKRQSMNNIVKFIETLNKEANE